MSTQMVNFDGPNKRKGFFSRPEGITGAIFLIGILAGLGFLIAANAAALLAFVKTVVGLTVAIVVIGLLLYMVLDPKIRNLVWYMYKSVMRSITGVFVKMDPIGILKSYVEDLEKNLLKLREQIGKMRGQMRKLQALMDTNNAEIESNMKLAQAARDRGKEKQMLLSSRKAARLRETNQKYQELYQRMQVLSRILNKMHQNSEILLEDTKDQVKLKEQERKAIRTSHSAMKSAMSVLSGDPDKRAMFEMAMEAITDDVASKVGEMERFMDMSANVMESIDLQNGVFEEEGLKMLEQWERESTLMLLGDNQTTLDTFDLDSPRAEPMKQKQIGKDSNYDKMFE